MRIQDSALREFPPAILAEAKDSATTIKNNPGATRPSKLQPHSYSPPITTCVTVQPPEPRSYATKHFSSRSQNGVRGTLLKMFKRRESLTSGVAKRNQEPRAREATKNFSSCEREASDKSKKRWEALQQPKTKPEPPVQAITSPALTLPQQSPSEPQIKKGRKRVTVPQRIPKSQS